MSQPKVLVFGGTHFIGRVLVEKILDEQLPYGLTLFNRGQSNPGIFPEIKRITGDRETSDIDAVLNSDWDYIIDVNGYYPDSIEQFIPKFKGKVGRYIYISTVSVYDPAYIGDALIGEDDPLLGCTPEQRKGSWAEHYGEKKAECERILLANHWLDTMILRPSIVYGKYDYTERFYYWLQRIKTRDAILIPNEGKERANLTFVNDLASMIVESLSMNHSRTSYNAVTHSVNTLLEKLEAIASVMDKSPKFISTSQSDIATSRNFPCTAERDYLIYDLKNVDKDFSYTRTPYYTSLKKTIEYYQATTSWKPGTRGMTIEVEDTLLHNLL